MDCRIDITPALTLLRDEVADLYSQHIEKLYGPPEPLSFYRSYVSQNRPAIIKNAVDHWPALKKWNISYLRNIIGKTEVTVGLTPNGYADAIYKDRFVMPEEIQMNMSDFLDIVQKDVDDREEKAILYIQKQNSNLTDEFAELLKDIDSHLEWGTKAFGSNPDAANFWMGDKNAVTSLHRDHYENLYCVISGTKTFTLFAPTDLPFLPYEKHKSACYRRNADGEFDIVDDENGAAVSWIAVDPLYPDLVRFPQFANARPITVTLEAGDVLYLPSLWFHHVQQSQGCIAVNYWYDMEFDIKWAYYKFLEKLTATPL